MTCCSPFVRSSLTMPVPIAAQAHQHMVINPAMRDVIDQKMTDAVVGASNGSRKDGLLHLTSDTVKRVFFAPAWNNRGGPDVKNPGLRRQTDPSFLARQAGILLTFPRLSRIQVLSGQVPEDKFDTIQDVVHPEDWSKFVLGEQPIGPMPPVDHFGTIGKLSSSGFSQCVALLTSDN